MNKKAFEVATLRKTKQYWLVGGRALLEIKVGDILKVHQLQEDSSSQLKVIGIATSGYAIPVLDPLWTANLTLQGGFVKKLEVGDFLTKSI